MRSYAGLIGIILAIVALAQRLGGYENKPLAFALTVLAAGLLIYAAISWVRERIARQEEGASIVPSIENFEVNNALNFRITNKRVKDGLADDVLILHSIKLWKPVLPGPTHDALANWVLVPKISPHQHLVNDTDPDCVLFVAVVKEAAPAQRDSHCSEVFRADAARDHTTCLFAGLWHGMPISREWQVGTFALWRQRGCDCHRFDARNAGDPFKQSLCKGHPVLLVRISVQHNLGGQHLRWLEAERHALQPPEALD